MNIIPGTSMRKSQLIGAIADETGVEGKVTARVVDAALNIIAAQIAAGGTVVLSNFGSWATTTTAERTAQNPRTGEPVTVPAHQKVKFRVSPHWKRAVRAGDIAAAGIRKARTK